MPGPRGFAPPLGAFSYERGTPVPRSGVAPPQDPTVGLCLGPMAVLGRGSRSYERGTIRA